MRSYLHRSPRHVRLLAAIALVSSAACADVATAPLGGRDVPAAALTRSANGAFDAFLQAQGAFCGSAALPCDPIYGDIGYIFAFGEDGEDAYMTIDPFGVNARWYPRHFPAISPAYAYDGSISEHRTSDGRRRITVNVRGRNTFVELYTSNGTVLGADLFAYGQVPPVLGDADASLEVIVPGDYVGYPDLVRVVYDAEPGTELVRYSGNVAAQGRTRADFQGIPAGTLVKATLHLTWPARRTGPRHPDAGHGQATFDPAVVLKVKPVHH